MYFQEKQDKQDKQEKNLKTAIICICFVQLHRILNQNLNIGGKLNFKFKFNNQTGIQNNFSI